VFGLDLRKSSPTRTPRPSSSRPCNPPRRTATHSRTRQAFSARISVAEITSADLPSELTTYALRDLDSLHRRAATYGDHIAAYAAARLEHPLPWTRMQQVYRLLGLNTATALSDQFIMSWRVGFDCGQDIPRSRCA